MNLHYFFSNYYNFSVKDFSNSMLKVLSIKVNKLESIKIKNLCLSNDMIKRVKKKK